jgi:hypothetical protein
LKPGSAFARDSIATPLFVNLDQLTRKFALLPRDPGFDSTFLRGEALCVVAALLLRTDPNIVNEEGMNGQGWRQLADHANMAIISNVGAYVIRSLGSRNGCASGSRSAMILLRENKSAITRNRSLNQRLARANNPIDQK